MLAFCASFAPRVLMGFGVAIHSLTSTSLGPFNPSLALLVAGCNPITYKVGCDDAIIAPTG